MRSRLISISALVGVSLSVALPGHAQVIFSDNFNGENPGLNVVPTAWTIGNSGTVDLIGVCNGNSPFFDNKPGNGCYVDLDGSTSSSGLLKKNFTLTGGIPYFLEFDLGSSASNTVDVTFGSTMAQYALIGSQPFSTRSLVFTPASTASYDLSFLNQGGDNNGAYLDNVKLTQTPGPLPILGAVAAARASRRLRARLRKAHP